MSGTDHPEAAWLLALLTLPRIGPSRLAALLDGRSPQAAWDVLVNGGDVVIDGVTGDQVRTWRAAARSTSVDQHWAATKELGMWLRQHGTDGYPERLSEDIEPPQLLFGLGREIGRQPTVGIIGTRNCTSYGKRCAFEFGAALAAAGVSVVSGLALGIDAAAHQGVLSVRDVDRAPPIGVVGSGLDIVYPKRNTSLWNEVIAHGTVVSETAPGVGPMKWRFPARNRIIAGLSDAVIVIESHESGGSLSTVDAAQERDKPVGVVPGPITSNSSIGTNRLLAEGATPILGVEDILCLIGHSAPLEVADATDVDATASTILDALGWNPLLFDELCSRVALSPSASAVEVERLIGLGLCRRSGPWIERVR